MHDPLISSNFFENFLPEGSAFGIFHLLKHLPPGDAFSFLAIYGRECAGALSVLPFGESFEELKEDYRDVTDMVISQLERPAKERKNLIAVTNSKVSLAGAQNKLPVLLEGNRLLVPTDESFAPTTHIIKSPSIVLPDLQYNEAFCVELARAVGLSAPKTELMKFGGIDVLAVERYDRIVRDGAVYRLHQEDFCQALGLFSQQKYEQQQGPGFSACSGVVGQCLNAKAAKENFAKAAIFNFILGNGDAHGKNFSILYGWSPKLGEHGKGFGLAPFYDIISTLLYSEMGVDATMAMSYGKTFDPTNFNLANFRLLAKDLGIEVNRLKVLAEEITESVNKNASNIATEHSLRFPSVGIYDKIISLIKNQIDILHKTLNGMKKNKTTKPHWSPRP
jgi:serine/threonine-protein kinase HipA